MIFAIKIWIKTKKTPLFRHGWLLAFHIYGNQAPAASLLLALTTVNNGNNTPLLFHMGHEHQSPGESPGVLL